MAAGNDTYGNSFKCKSQLLNNLFGDERTLKFRNFAAIVERTVTYSFDERHVFFMHWTKLKYGLGMEHLPKAGYVNI